MRYYRIVVTDPDTGNVYNPMKQDPTSTWTSFINGVNLPGALTVELDIPLAPQAAPTSQGALVRIWGISLATIAQATNFNFKNIQIWGGMKKGLPLANPNQIGLLLQGTIVQAFGNWQGTSMTLDLIVMGLQRAPTLPPANLVVNWKKGQKLGDVLRATLATAYPNYTPVVNISDNLVLNHDEPGFYGSLPQLAAWVKQVSKDTIGGTTYQGVDLATQGLQLIVYDGTAPPNIVTALSFTDLIGQPTWIGAYQIQVQVVLRGDLGLGSLVSLPKTQLTTSSSSQSTFSPNQGGVAFQGTFAIQSLRHIGNSRDPNGASWVTVIDLYTSASPTSTQAP